MEINLSGRPPLPPGMQRNKTIYVSLNQEQYEQLTTLSELMQERKIGTFVYKVVEKLLKDNAASIQKYKEAKQTIKL